MLTFAHAIGVVVVGRSVGLSGQSLARWDIASGFTPQRIERVRALPRFGEALRCSVREALALAGGNPLTQRSFGDIVRFALGTLVLYLDATGGLTAERLHEEFGSSMLARGRVMALLLQLRTAGYVVSDVGPDGRARRFVPTARLREAFNARSLIQLKALAILDADAAGAAARLTGERAWKLFWRHTGELLLTAGRHPLPGFGSFDAFTRRRGGMLLLFALFGLAGDDSVFTSGATLRTTQRELAALAQIPRRQAAALLATLEADGHVARRCGGKGEEITILPALADRFSRYLAVVLIGHGCALYRTLRDL